MSHVDHKNENVAGNYICNGMLPDQNKRLQLIYWVKKITPYMPIYIDQKQKIYNLAIMPRGPEKGKYSRKIVFGIILAQNKEL